MGKYFHYSSEAVDNLTPKQIKIYLQEVNELELEEQLEKYFDAGGKAEGLEGVLQEKYYELYAEGYNTEIKISETDTQNISKEMENLTNEIMQAKGNADLLKKVLPDNLNEATK